MTSLSIEALAKRFAGRPVLRGVDLTVEPGEIVALLGPSGSGKTTLLRLVCGFERADAGRIRLAGRTLCEAGLHLPPERRGIGYVAQEGALFPHLSVADNILFGLSRRDRRESARAARLLDMVGLPAIYAGRPPHALSGGEQQRVALARALASAPRLVLLDEPFSALDAALRVETRQTVAQALAEAGAAALLVTHDQAEALSVGHRVAVLRDGHIVQIDTPQGLYHRPVDPILAHFVGEAVVLPGHAVAGAVDCALGRLALRDAVPDGAVRVLLRPEQLRLDGGDQAGISARVTGLTFYGHDASAALVLVEQVPGTESVALSARVPGHAAPRPGDLVSVSVAGPVVAFPSPP